MRIITVCSGKGGVGKTTVTANLGVALASAGKRTLLVDMDLGLRNLDVVLGLETQVFYHIGDVIKGECTLEEALVTSNRYPNLRLLPAVQATGGLDVNREAVKEILEQVKDSIDIVLLDCPAGIGELFQLCTSLSGEGIVVTTPVVSAVRDADKVLHLLEDNGMRRRQVIVNMVRPELVKLGVMMEPEDITDVLGIPLLGVVPDDVNVLACANEGRPVCGMKCPAGKAYVRIGRRIQGEDVAIPPLARMKKKKLLR